MTSSGSSTKSCVIVGASHAGVNCAFALRKEGWTGKIILLDKDPTLPYHRPPLSKAYLTTQDGIEKNLLKPEESYTKNNIELILGVTALSIDKVNKTISLSDERILDFDNLVLATGSRPIVPPIKGLDTAINTFTLRTAEDVNNIRHALPQDKKKVVIIGGGYIGLEAAASLRKMQTDVTILEREARVLARVTAPEMSYFFQNLHDQKGVKIYIEKNVTSIDAEHKKNLIHCSDGSVYEADILIIGVGVRVNSELAQTAFLNIDNGIKVSPQSETSEPGIYAIGDNTNHFNPHYQKHVRLESVQNAVDQAKIAAAAMMGKQPEYNALPWFWSDQYEIKLQMVGLSNGYDQIILRHESSDENKFSAWYFKGDTLLAVDAVNHAKAYVIGTKLIKQGNDINKEKLADSSIELTPAGLSIKE